MGRQQTMNKQQTHAMGKDVSLVSGVVCGGRGALIYRQTVVLCSAVVKEQKQVRSHGGYTHHHREKSKNKT